MRMDYLTTTPRPTRERHCIVYSLSVSVRNEFANCYSSGASLSTTLKLLHTIIIFSWQPPQRG